ncbi:MAG: peptidylprolyl isomerase [Pseudomonadales bacterium]|nr:peptidylprolyl isomerase [Pseudomonadales bacterium]MDP6315861.1 peptidylprolyl isomerase [Pseudomonadales bacterium]MDP7314726.1 peptidylprolyl isomerase [Pseudomonadales bacterium]MDP7576593.1 peptidylprolyl isomerase [Pseudomonadales bacterium]
MPMYYKFDYAIRNESDEIVDSSAGGEVLSFVEGDGSMIAGLEKAFVGREVGDEFSVTVGPEEAYGWPQRQLIKTISRDMIQTDAEEIKVNMIFQIGSGTDSQVVKVVSVEKDGITVDGNHPLAGIALNFDIQVLEVRQVESDLI